MARYGLQNLDNELFCPLQSVNVTSTFVDRFGSAVVTQVFQNNSKDTIEAVFTFPKDDRAAVTGFKVKINDKTLHGQIESSDEAQEKYSDAIAEGKGAYLLAQKRSDIVSLYIGSLLPNQKVTIELKYVIEAQWEGDALRITFPTTIAPRYTPQQFQRDEEHQINPAYHSNDDKLPYDFSLSSSIQLTHDTISSFESPTHEFDVTLAGDRKEIKIEAKLNSGDNMANRDVVLIVHSLEREQRKAPVLIDEVDKNGHHALYISFIPKIVTQAATIPRSQYEIIFLVDRSGSMSSAMENCKAALLLFLRSLPSDSFFNVVSFGSNHVSLYKTPQAYNNSSLENATKHVQKFGADLGGTEIFAPLKQILSASQQKNRKRVVFVLTDGEVSNSSQVVDLVRSHASTTSVYTFGLGSNVSRTLCNGMAQAGKGYAEYASGNERLQPKIIRQLKSALDSFSVKVNWKSKDVKMFPKNVMPTNEDEPVHFMAFIDDKDYFNKVEEIELLLESDGKAFKTTLPLNSLKQVQGKKIHQMFVKHEADSLAKDARPAKKDKVRALCKKYHVLSNLTSFLVVERRTVATESTPTLVNVPLAKPQSKVHKSTNLGKVNFVGDTSFSESFITTIGVDFKINTVNLGSAGTAKSQNWDTAGQERFRSISTTYYRGANSVILVYSIDRSESFKQLNHYYSEAQNSCGPSTAFILVGNKLDLQANRQVSYDEGLAWATQHNMSFFEVSAKDLSNMAEMVQTLYNDMYMKQWESGAYSVNFKSISVGDSGVGKSAITDRMSGFSIDLSDLTERFPLGTNSSASNNNNNISTTAVSNTNAEPSVLGKLWSGFTGLFSRKNTTQAVTNTAPVTSAPIQKDQAISYTNYSTQSGGSTIGQTNTNVSSINNTNASTTSKLSSKSMDAMLLLQEAAGNWKLHQHLAKLLNIDWTAIESTRPKEVNNDDAWMTLVCIAYLHIICGQHKAEWELIVQKAENWLKSVGANKSEWNQRARQLIQQSI